MRVESSQMPGIVTGIIQNGEDLHYYDPDDDGPIADCGGDNEEFQNESYLKKTPDTLEAGRG